MAAAVRYAKDLGAGKRVAVVLPDSVRNYMTKFLSDSWMVEHDFMEATEPEGLDTWWAKRTVADLPLQVRVQRSLPTTLRALMLAAARLRSPSRRPSRARPRPSCSTPRALTSSPWWTRTARCAPPPPPPPSAGARALLTPATAAQVRGMVSAGNLTAKLVSGRLHRDDPVTKAMFHQFKQVREPAVAARGAARCHPGGRPRRADSARHFPRSPQLHLRPRPLCAGHLHPALRGQRERGQQDHRLRRGDAVRAQLRYGAEARGALTQCPRPQPASTFSSSSCPARRRDPQRDPRRALELLHH